MMPENHPNHTCLLDPDFGIPTDVTFQIIEFEDIENENEIVVGEVKGHKLILGLYSSVFRRQFYGPAKETEDIIPIKQTTLEAFNLMFDYIYSKKIVLSGLSVLKLYDVVNLAEKYDISGLMEEIKNWMENIPLSIENVMEVANTAAQFTHFPATSSQLLLKCAKFIKQTLRTQARMQEFVRFRNGQEMITVQTLMTLVRDLKAQEMLPKDHALMCSNCKMDECQNGKRVSMVFGLSLGCKVTINNQSGTYWNRFGSNEYGEIVYTVVQELQENIVKIRDVIEEQEGIFYILRENIPTFIYKCK